MMDKPKKGTKVKTIDRGQYAPNVTVKSIPEFKPKGPFPMLDLDYNKKTSDSTSKKKMGGKVKKAQSGASLKPVPAGKKGLAKLPTPVRNKMGFQKNGGKMKK